MKNMRNYKDNLCECPLWMECEKYEDGACGLKNKELKKC